MFIYSSIVLKIWFKYCTMMDNIHNIFQTLSFLNQQYTHWYLFNCNNFFKGKSFIFIYSSLFRKFVSKTALWLAIFIISWRQWAQSSMNQQYPHWCQLHFNNFFKVKKISYLCILQLLKLQIYFKNCIMMGNIHNILMTISSLL